MKIKSILEINWIYPRMSKPLFVFEFRAIATQHTRKFYEKRKEYGAMFALSHEPGIWQILDFCIFLVSRNERYVGFDCG